MSMDKYFTKDARKRADKYADAFRAGVFLMTDEEVMRLFTIQHDMIREGRQKRFMEVMKKFEEEYLGGKKG